MLMELPLSARGGHDLVKDGAYLVDEPGEVLTHLGLVADAGGQGQMAFVPTPPTPKTVAPSTASAVPISVTPVPSTAPSVSSPAPSSNLTEDEAAFFAQLTLNPAPFDQVALGANLPVPRANVAATLLEIKGLISRKPGNLFALAQA